MDLLGSILGSMTKPPGLSDQEKAKRKQAQKAEEQQKKAVQNFRTSTEKRINAFVSDEAAGPKMVLPPMPKYERSIVHDVAEVAGLVALSFGTEDVDRHVVLYRREHAPGEDELACLRQGLPWDPVQHAKNKELHDKIRKQEEEEEKTRKKEKFVPKTDYRDKYEHLIGKDAALDAARKTVANKSFGMVSAEQKKDKRTVEMIQAEIRAKKKRKLDNPDQDDT